MEIVTMVDKKLLAPYIYLNAIPGEGMERELIIWLNHWMNTSEQKLQKICFIIFHFHQTSLLLDDIQDNATLRRGVPAAHCIYGVPNSTNAAKFMFPILIDKVIELNHSKALCVYFNRVIEGLEGQGLELYWRDNLICPTEDEYSGMVVKKTGALFLLALQLMQLFSTNEQDPIPLAKTLGLFFQINNDYQSLTSERAKGFCDDIEEGKFSFPIVHAINNNAHKGVYIKYILSQRPKDFYTKKLCLDMIEKCGSLEYTRMRLIELRKALYGEIQKFGRNPLLQGMLQMFSSD